MLLSWPGADLAARTLISHLLGSSTARRHPVFRPAAYCVVYHNTTPESTAHAVSIQHRPAQGRRVKERPDAAGVSGGGAPAIDPAPGPCPRQDGSIENVNESLRPANSVL